MSQFLEHPLERVPAPAVTQASQTTVDAARQLDMALAALELLAQVAATETLEAGCVAVVNALKNFLRCEGVAIAFVERARKRCKLQAISSVSEISAQSEVAAALEEFLQNTWASVGARHTECAGYIAAEPGAIEVLKLKQLLGGAEPLAVPLRSAKGDAQGAIALWGRPGQFEAAAARSLLRAAEEPITAALALLQQSEAGRARRIVSGVVRKFRKPLYAGLAFVALGVLLFWPYRVSFDCSVEPLKRRFVVAPFAGVFEKSLVRPGDEVRRDQVLAQLDGRELRMELASLEAEFERVQKSRDVNLAAGKVAATQIDKLELKRLEQKRKLLEYRNKNLEIRSPVKGIVVSGDQERSEGAPVEVGQVLYEIAPLTDMIVEVAVDDEQVTHISVGEEVTVALDAYSGRQFTGRVTKLHPRAEIRDSQNVFVAEVVLEEGPAGEADVELRPGMKGKVKLSSSELLSVVLAKRAWYAAASFLGCE